MGTQAAAPAKARTPAARKGTAAAPARAPAEEPDADRAAELVLRRCACGGSCPRCRGSGAHPPLTINTPGDAFEREADAVADAVMFASPASPSAASAPRALRRCACGGSCPSCRKEKEEEALHRDAAGGGSPGVAPAIVHDVLSAPGRPLAAPARRFMETRFGADFSGVRVHDDARATESARAVDAHAYTVGRDIVFASGRYAPGTAGGDRLLAHELAHVVQQGDAIGAPSRTSARVMRQTTSSDPSADLLAVPAGETTIPLKPPEKQEGCINGKWYPIYDGCSCPKAWRNIVDKILDKDNPAGGKDTQFANEAHTGPCDKHDECYQTCYTSEGARKECDEKMLEQMHDVCDKAPKSSRIRNRCFRFAGIYYTLLRRAGGAAFRERQRQVCACTIAIPAGQGTQLPSVPSDGTRR